MIFRYLSFCFSFVSLTALSQAPPIAWQQCLSTGSYFQDNGIVRTTDGGIAVASQKNVNGNTTPISILVARYDAQHTILWQTVLGGSQEDVASDLVQTPDGGFLVVGSTESNDGQVSGNHGGRDLWLVKISSTGSLEWQKCLGGSGFDTGYKIATLPDGDYVLTGTTNSNDGDVSGNHGKRDVWTIKVSAQGDIRWQRCQGGSDDEEGFAIIASNDAGLVVAGYTLSNDQQVNGNHGNSDLWVAKLSVQGDLQWQRCLGGSKAEAGAYRQIGLVEIPAGYAVAANTLSNDGDVTGYHGDRSLNVHGDGWLVWLDRSGSFIRQRCFGGTESDRFTSLVATPDSGLVAVGFTNSVDGDAQRPKPFSVVDTDYWYARINATGELLWQKAIGSTTVDIAHRVILGSAGEYITVGSTSGPDGDVSPTIACSGGAAWIVALGPDPICPSPADLSLFAYTSTVDPALNEPITVIINVRNSGPRRAENIQLLNRLPANLEFIASPDFSTTPDGLLSTLTGLDAGAIQQLKFIARPTAPGYYRSAIQVIQASGCDPDSRFNSGTGDGEDDMAVVSFRTIEPANTVFNSPNPNQIPLPPVASNQPTPDPSKADLSIQLAVGNQTPIVNGLTSVSIIVANRGGRATGGIALRVTLPPGIEVLSESGESTTGSFVLQPSGSIPVGQKLILPFSARATRSDTFVLLAEVMAADTADSDSSPGNGTTNGEDDTAQVALRVR